MCSTVYLQFHKYICNATIYNNNSKCSIVLKYEFSGVSAYSASPTSVRGVSVIFIRTRHLVLLGTLETLSVD